MASRFSSEADSGSGNPALVAGLIARVSPVLAAPASAPPAESLVGELFVALGSPEKTPRHLAIARPERLTRLSEEYWPEAYQSFDAQRNLCGLSNLVVRDPPLNSRSESLLPSTSRPAPRPTASAAGSHRVDARARALRRSSFVPRSVSPSIGGNRHPLEGSGPSSPRARF